MNTSARMTLLVGFVAGVVFATSCGGGGENQVRADDVPVPVRLHRVTLADLLGSNDAVALSANSTLDFNQMNFTSDDPLDTVLGFIVRLTYSGDTPADAGSLELEVHSEDGTVLVAAASAALTGGTDELLSLIATADVAIAPQTVYQLRVRIAAGSEAISFLPAGLRFVLPTTGDLQLVDPSPSISLN